MTDQDTQVTPDGLFSSEDSSKSDNITLSQDEIQKIVKQNLNAQEHIKNLESETKQYREQLSELQNELTKSRTIDELLESIQQQNTDTPGPTAPQINKEELLNELKAEVFRDLSAAQQSALEEQNAAEAVRAAEELYGEGYKSYVQQKAADLGVSLEQMEQYAKTSPKVFMELLGGQKSQTPTPTIGNQTLPPSNDSDIEARYKRVSTLRLMNTPEGIEARRLWESDEFQSQYRRHVLEKAQKEGSDFRNQI